MSEASIKEAPRMNQFPSPSNEGQARVVKYCDRCARGSRTLSFDDLTLQELCQECCDRLKRKREMTAHPAKI